MNKGKVLVTNYVHDVLIAGLGDIGYEVIYDKNFDPDGLEAILPQLAGIIINTKIKMTAERIRLGSHLKFIGRLGSGLDIIDLEAASKKGVAVFNSPEGNRNAVAEHAMGMLLALCNNMLRADKEVRSKVWRREYNRGIELEGKTLGIVGFGNTGQSLARKVSGWALDTLYYDPYLLKIPKDFSNIEPVSIEELQRRSDIISLHVQLTSETRQLVDREFLKACKSGVILINTSRGAVVDTRALVELLEAGHLGGACLDVFHNEKPHTFTPEEHQLFDRLYAMDNVVLTPHVAGWTHLSLRKIGEVLLNKISKLQR